MKCNESYTLVGQDIITCQIGEAAAALSSVGTCTQSEWNGCTRTKKVILIRSFLSYVIVCRISTLIFKFPSSVADGCPLENTTSEAYGEYEWSETENSVIRSQQCKYDLLQGEPDINLTRKCLPDGQGEQV